MRTLDELLGPKQFVGDEDMDPRSVPLTERDGDVFVVAHHSVSRTLQAILAEFFSPNRSLSGTAAVGPVVAGQDDYQSRQCVPWNTHRPFTTASSIDNKALTFEMANLVLAPPWPVGDTGKYWLAELIAAAHVELGMPIDRWHVTCHSEVYERGWGSYPTACCGDDLRNYLDRACEDAIRIVAGEEPEKESTEMKIISDANGAQKFADEFGVDDIGAFFFVPNGPTGTPSWVDNINAAWLLAGQPEQGREGSWDLELARHIGNARWDAKRGQIVTDTTRVVVPAIVAALTPLFEKLAPEIDMDAVSAAVHDAATAALADVVVTPEPLTEEQVAAIAKASADEEDRRERERLGRAS